MFEVKCDDCKTTIRETDSVSESAAGGLCDECRRCGEQATATVHEFHDGTVGQHFHPFEEGARA